jgi:hypothetical protein
MLQYTRCEIIQFAHRIPKNYQNWLDERVFVEQNNEIFAKFISRIKSLGTTCEVVKNMVLVKDDLRKNDAKCLLAPIIAKWKAQYHLWMYKEIWKGSGSFW